MFFDPLPLARERNLLILFLLSEFWGPSPAQCGRHMLMPPLPTAVRNLFSSGSLCETFFMVKGEGPIKKEFGAETTLGAAN